MAPEGKRVAVVGATGNIGTSVVRALSDDPGIDEVLALSRRHPPVSSAKVRWQRTDVREDDLVDRFSSVDTVIHLGWLFQPTRNPLITWHNNVIGSIRVFDAAAAAGVRDLVHASSVAAYGPGRGTHPVTEQSPTHGWPTSAYSREKAYLERYLDAFELRHPEIRVVRMRTAFCFQPRSAEEQRRLFAGPFVINRLVRPDLLPVLPVPKGLRFQSVHSADVGESYRLAVHSERGGAFNIAADPLIDATALGELLGTRTTTLPPRLVRRAVAAAWNLHLVPASPGLFATFMNLPVMDTGRARQELGWTPQHSSTTAVEEFLRGLREATGANTPPLRSPLPGGRVQELRTGVGQRP